MSTHGSQRASRQPSSGVWTLAHSRWPFRLPPQSAAPSPMAPKPRARGSERRLKAEPPARGARSASTLGREAPHRAGATPAATGSMSTPVAATHVAAYVGGALVWGDEW